jgi:hypothetical protein
MKLFYITDQNGNILRYGSCLDEDLNGQVMNPGEIVNEGAPPNLAPMSFDLFGTGYVADRLRAYPKIGDQLDMLWHAMDLDNLTKVEPFYSTIKSVKDTYPKT